jgi:AcrR family transcriptional regulator
MADKILDMADQDSTREQILLAALTMLNKYGYGGLSLSALAEQVGMTKQRVHYHFPEIESIVVILAERWSQTGQQTTMECLAETKEVAEMKVLAIGEGMFRWIKRDPELARLGLVLFQSSPHVESLRKFMVHSRTIARERIKALLLQSPKLKKKKEAQLAALVTELHAQMYGHAFYALIMGDLKNLDRYRELCLNGLRNSIQAVK